MITIHRKDQPWLTALQERGLANVPLKHATRSEGIQVHLLTQLFNAALDTYQRPLEEVENTLDRFDTKVFEGDGGGSARSSGPTSARSIGSSARSRSASGCSGGPWT